VQLLLTGDGMQFRRFRAAWQKSRNSGAQSAFVTRLSLQLIKQGICRVIQGAL
jgi:hypothetical protein